MEKVALAGRGGWIVCVVDAHIRGPFAIHRNGGKGAEWRVSLRELGVAIGRYFWWFRDACAYAAELRGMDAWDYASLDEIPQGVKEAAKKIYARYVAEGKAHW